MDIIHDDDVHNAPDQTSVSADAIHDDDVWI